MNRLLLLLLSLTFCMVLHATDTKIMVRVKAKDAKFVGSSIGGALVIIKEKVTGTILAKGKTEGSTGDTRLIMRVPKERYQQLSDANTAGYQATIDIDEPTFITVEVYSPANHRQAQVAAQTELWLIPGKHILGDGVVIEIPGFIIDILKPLTHQTLSISALNGPLQLQANIVMMCGCTIENGGLWDAEKMEVQAIIKQNGRTIITIPMQNVGPNVFDGRFDVKGAGMYEVIVYAYDERTGNTGVDKVNFIVYD